MVSKCCVPGCRGIHGYHFPRDPVAKRAWLVAIGRLGKWEPTKNSKICRAHFVKDDFHPRVLHDVRIMCGSRNKLKSGSIPRLVINGKSTVLRKQPTPEEAKMAEVVELIDPTPELKVGKVFVRYGETRPRFRCVECKIGFPNEAALQEHKDVMHHVVVTTQNDGDQMATNYDEEFIAVDVKIEIEEQPEEEEDPGLIPPSDIKTEVEDSKEEETESGLGIISAIKTEIEDSDREEDSRLIAPSDIKKEREDPEESEHKKEQQQQYEEESDSELPAAAEIKKEREDLEEPELEQQQQQQYEEGSDSELPAAAEIKKEREDPEEPELEKQQQQQYEEESNSELPAAAEIKDEEFQLPVDELLRSSDEEEDGDDDGDEDEDGDRLETGKNPKVGESVIQKQKSYRHKLMMHKALQSKKQQLYQCQKCYSVYRTRHGLNKHQTMHENEVKGPKVCKICSQSFQTTVQLHIHSETHSQTPCNCPECPETFMDEESLRRHSLKHRKQWKSPYKCDTCGQGFTTRHSLDLHKKTHKPKSFQCPDCSKSFAYEENFRKHCLEHCDASEDSEPPFDCDKCNMIFMDRDEFDQHRGTHAKNRKIDAGIVCELCLTVYSTEAEFLEHQQVHAIRSSSGWSCDTCQKNYLTESALLEHQKVYHVRNVKSWACDICQGIYPSRSRLAQHKRSHLSSNSADRMLSCRICHTIYPDQLLLEEHLKTHNLGLQSVYSRAKIADDRELGDVEMSQLNEGEDKDPLSIDEPPKLQCSTCQAKFYSKTELGKHEKSHSGSMTPAMKKSQALLSEW